MDRSQLISELKSELNVLNNLLIKKYKHDLVLEFQEVEKEIEIQQSYLEHEGN